VPPALVTPGIDNQENENYEAQDQKDHRSGFPFPELLKAPCDVVGIHAAKITLTYRMPKGRKKGNSRGAWLLPAPPGNAKTE